ncbi:MAG TPA: double-CXXCG motif protein [Myxococcaceae bacterium]|nr:double-CXXCG motif protein [Myxococcaceae bacterium]
MRRFYWLRPDEASNGDVSAAHKWGLPGIHCPTCGTTWADGSDAYPSVDLSALPEMREFEVSRPEPFAEFARLREIVRPLMPPGVPLEPGTEIGPLVGTASGTFTPLFMQNPWTLLALREALEQLQAEGLRGLKGCRTELRFRKKTPPELLELEIHPHGRLHDDCLPPDRKPPCETCGRQGFTRPEELLLDAASLPTHTDLFRLANWTTMIMATERFAETARRLDLNGVIFKELPLR